MWLVSARHARTRDNAGHRAEIDGGGIVRLRSRFVGIGKTRIIDGILCARTGRTGARLVIGRIGDRRCVHSH
jgi:hypothetical protein